MSFGNSFLSLLSDSEDINFPPSPFRRRGWGMRLYSPLSDSEDINFPLLLFGEGAGG